MSDEDDLRAFVVGTLRAQACKSITFTIVGTTIMAYGYGYVADMIANGTVGVAIGDTGAFDASYDHPQGGSPAITFGPDFSSNAEGRCSIVHECTHAVVDAVRVHRSISYGDSEVTAYLAETIYRLNSNIATLGGAFVGQAIVDLANRVRSCSGIYVVQDAERIAIRTQILATYTLLAQSMGKSVPATIYPQGIGLSPTVQPAMVPDGD